VQMLTHTRQNGALYVNADLLDGIIFLENGILTHAECGDTVGDDAMVQIVKHCNGQDSGSYKFIPGESATTRTVLRSSTELMLEALRELDEATQSDLDGGL